MIKQRAKGRARRAARIQRAAASVAMPKAAQSRSFALATGGSPQAGTSIFKNLPSRHDSTQSHSTSAEHQATTNGNVRPMAKAHAQRPRRIGPDVAGCMRTEGGGKLG